MHPMEHKAVVVVEQSQCLRRELHQWHHRPARSSELPQWRSTQALPDSVHRGSDCCGCTSNLSNQHPDYFPGDLALGLHSPSTTIAQPDISCLPLMHFSRATNFNLSAKELSFVWMARNGTGGVSAMCRTWRGASFLNLERTDVPAFRCLANHKQGESQCPAT